MITVIGCVDVMCWCSSGGSSSSSNVLWIYRISYMYYGLVSMSVAFIVGISVSLITGKLIVLELELELRLDTSCRLELQSYI